MFLKNRVGLYQHATLDTILVAVLDANRCNYHAKVSRTEVLHKLCLDYNVLNTIHVHAAVTYLPICMQKSPRIVPGLDFAYERDWELFLKR